MPSQKMIVLDADSNFNHPDGMIEIHPDFRIEKRTLRCGVESGVEVLDIDNGWLSMRVLLTRGMGIQRVDWAGGRLGWDSPVSRIVHPRHIDLSSRGGLGWLEGFNEWLVRCGVAWAGAAGGDGDRELTLHGRIANQPAARVELLWDSNRERLEINGLVEEKTFKFEQFELWTSLSIEPQGRSIRIRDRLMNLSAYDQEYQLIYHTNFGPPILEADSRFLAPVETLFPLNSDAAEAVKHFDLYREPTPGFGEQVYCMRMLADDRGWTTTLLHNAESSLGVALRYDTNSLPAFNLWKNTDSLADGYVTGLEPSTSFPLNRRVEREAGRVPKLASGTSIGFPLEFEILEGSAAVELVKSEIAGIQGEDTSRIGRQPLV